MKLLETGFLKTAGVACFYAYAWFLVIPGGILGLFVPRWGPLDFEVFARVIFNTSLDPEAMASTLNQYRFMKSVEFAFGLFALLFREEIFTIKKFSRFFLGIVFLGAGIRALSIFVDGRPHPAYVFFTFLELTIGLIVFLCSRRTLIKS